MPFLCFFKGCTIKGHQNSEIHSDGSSFQRNVLSYNPSECDVFSSPRWMYWTDWEEDPTESNRGKIKKAWMDGSHHQVFLTSKTVLWPNGLSLDIPQGILYWVDAYYDRIELVYLNTTERKVGDAQGIYLESILFVYLHLIKETFLQITNKKAQFQHVGHNFKIISLNKRNILRSNPSLFPDLTGGV